jgi:DNA-binding CsgD family transcriptional regulator
VGTTEFSTREAEILRLVAIGFSDKEIGRALGISHKTVETELGRLYRRRGFRGRAHAAVAWVLSNRDTYVSASNMVRLTDPGQ